MQIFALLIHNGRIVTLEVERGDTVDAVYEMLGEHPTVLPFRVQRVMFEQRHMPRRKGHTLDMYGVELESTLHVVARPPPPTVRLSVGGVAFNPVLDTLMAVPDSVLFNMFEDVLQGGKPRRAAASGADSEPAEGVPGQQPQLLAQDGRGAYIIERPSAPFGYVLSYLKRLSQGVTSIAEMELPPTTHEIAALIHEAEYFGLEKLASDALQANAMLRPRADGRPGCEHSLRQCKLVTPCGGEAHWCERCHSDAHKGPPAGTSADAGPAPRELDRKAVTKVICAGCNLSQPVGSHCWQCGTSFGKYTCLVCNVFDDDLSKKIFHCAGCGMCRVRAPPIRPRSGVLPPSLTRCVGARPAAERISSTAARATPAYRSKPSRPIAARRWTPTAKPAPSATSGTVSRCCMPPR